LKPWANTGNPQRSQAFSISLIVESVYGKGRKMLLNSEARRNAFLKKQARRKRARFAQLPQLTNRAG
jgi:hypothetical protein